MKKKKFILRVATAFPKGHPRSGEPTMFNSGIEGGTKIHTIRENYQYWKNIIDQVNEDQAFISVVNWAGKPFRSKQIEFKQLHKGQVGIQSLNLVFPMGWFIDRYDSDLKTITLAHNDGLALNDFNSWFQFKLATFNPDIDEMAIIHFTDFRYTNSNTEKTDNGNLRLL